MKLFWQHLSSAKRFLLSGWLTYVSLISLLFRPAALHHVWNSAVWHGLFRTIYIKTSTVHWNSKVKDVATFRLLGLGLTPKVCLSTVFVSPTNDLAILRLPLHWIRGQPPGSGRSFAAPLPDSPTILYGSIQSRRYLKISTNPQVAAPIWSDSQAWDCSSCLEFCSFIFAVLFSAIFALSLTFFSLFYPILLLAHLCLFLFLPQSLHWGFTISIFRGLAAWCPLNWYNATNPISLSGYSLTGVCHRTMVFGSKSGRSSYGHSL